MELSETDELIVKVNLATWRTRIGLNYCDVCRPRQTRWKSSGCRLYQPGVASWGMKEVMNDTHMVMVIPLLLVIAGDVETNPGPGEPSLRTLLNELYPVRASWYNIGLELGIPHTTLDCFKQNHSDQLELIREVLKHWLDTAVNPPPTWEAIVRVLTSPIVNKKYVAEQLESKYCTLASCKKEESNHPTMAENSEDEAKKEYRKVKEENLGLKQERQQLLERVAGLESKVLEGQIQQSVAAVEPTVKLLVQAQRKIEQAKENLCALSNQPASIALSPIVDLSRANRPQVRFEETSDLQRTSPLKPRILHPNTPHPLSTNSSISDEGPQLTSTPVAVQTHTHTHTHTVTTGRRPKRRCTSLPVSYQQPSLHKKLRRGDPFTEKSTDWSPPDKKKKRKKKATTINKISGIKQRKALQELTNH